jgi:methylthioribulose-1-phosphate dehydratase
MNDLAQALVDTCRLFGERQWCPATGGNFSARLDDGKCLITRSGCDKARLVVDDLITCSLNGEALHTPHRPSAETALHTCLYRLDPGIGAVLHTHSVNATVLSRRAADRLQLHGFEMQKALGNHTHDECIELPVFDNDQNIDALAAQLEDRWRRQQLAQPGFLVRGHGLYAWGRDLDEARRNVEGFEFLFACLVQERLLALS